MRRDFRHYISRLSKQMMAAVDGEEYNREDKVEEAVLGTQRPALARTVVFKVEIPGSDLGRGCSKPAGEFLTALSNKSFTQGTCIRLPAACKKLF